MSLTVAGMLGISFLSGVACFFFGAIWGRDGAYKEMRNLHGYIAKQTDDF